jgi:hypothetical protein
VCKVAAGVPLSHPRFRACLVSLFSDACLKQAPLSLILHVLVIAYEAALLWHRKTRSVWLAFPRCNTPSMVGGDCGMIEIRI